MTITLTREEAQQVLDALDGHSVYKVEAAIEFFRARLAQPEPKPQEAIAKWIKTNTEHREWYICPKCSYQAPRFKDEWQGLTDEEKSEIYNRNYSLYAHDMHIGDFFLIQQAIEAKLKEKNA
jgi:hypothetical protein